MQTAAEKAKRMLNLLRLLDVIFTSVTRSVVVLMAVVTGSVVAGDVLVHSLLDAATLFSYILVGTLVFEGITGGLRFITNLLIQKQVDKLVSDLKTTDGGVNLRGTDLLTTKNEYFN